MQLYLLAILALFGFTYKVAASIYGLLFMPYGLKNRLNNFYTRHSSYYNALSPKLQNKFLSRIHALSFSIKIKGRQEFNVTDEVKWFVLGSLVQLTFGLNHYKLSKFRHIIIYPDAYISPITKKLHHGEVHPRGLIVLSWKSFVKGYAIPDDCINLGLHELAHAFMHTIMYTKNHEMGLDEQLESIIKISKQEIEKIKSGNTHYFRAYAGSNIHEFFAVAIEYFFEDPKGFKENLPILYKRLSHFLKQDPANNCFRLKLSPIYKSSYTR